MLAKLQLILCVLLALLHPAVFECWTYGSNDIVECKLTNCSNVCMLQPFSFWELAKLNVCVQIKSHTVMFTHAAVCLTVRDSPRIKITFNVSSSNSSLKSTSILLVGFNTSIFTNSYIGERFNITYNTCTSRGESDMFCHEAIVCFSLRQMNEITYVLFFRLYMIPINSIVYTEFSRFPLELQGLFCVERVC